MPRAAATPAGKTRRLPAAKKRRAQSATAEFERQLKKTLGARRYVLRLYVTGTTPRSAQAIANVRALCEEYLAGRHDLEVVDIYQQPTEASAEQIIAAPTLVKKLPAPPRRMVGDFSDRNKMLVALDLREKPAVAGQSPVAKWLKP